MTSYTATKAARVERIKSALGSRTMSVKEIRVASGLPKSTLQDYITLLRADGQIHIARQVKIESTVILYYAWGAGKDAKRPPRLPSEIIYKRRVKAERSDPERIARRIARDRLRHAKNRIKKMPAATWFSVIAL
jgi:hypothetical protein